MQELKGRTAVITGAGSGFGREFAKLCAAEGMSLVLADIDEQGLDATAAMLPQAKLALQRCNVAEQAEVDALAAIATERFGGAQLLFNNAGVGVSGPTWTTTLEEWRWVLDVNVMGVVHGIRSFTQGMIDSGQDCHIVNTASAAGMLSVPGSSIYCASKHAVVTISECLHHELRMLDSRVNVSVLCPAFVKTGIADSDRSRPADAPKNPHPLTAQMDAMTRHAVNSGRLSAEDVMRETLQAVKDNRFYVLTHPGIKRSIEGRLRHILDDLPPHNTLSEKP